MRRAHLAVCDMAGTCRDENRRRQPRIGRGGLDRVREMF